MSTNPTASILEHFEGLTDPRVERTKEHQLLDIIAIALCAVICGAEGWTQVEEWGRSKETWLRTFLALPNGIPSHDTFGRLFARLDGAAFQACFVAWVQAVYDLTAGQVIAVDGKTLRRSHDRYIGKAAIHMVSAWASANHLVLGQRKVADKSNEITAIPLLLEVLALKGCIVTIDAMGCQKAIAQKIVTGEADYVLALKANQGDFHHEAVALFTYADKLDFHKVRHDHHTTIEKDHGRIEIRHCWTVDDPAFLRALPEHEKWPNLNTLVKVEAERRWPHKTEREARYYITSLPSNAAKVLQALRTHWSIENQLHWVLDVAFREDDSRVRQGDAPQNFAILRHMALNLLMQESSLKGGIQTKRLKAAWDHSYLLKVLHH
jgi:predicted transposase YbfD/YdcC